MLICFNIQKVEFSGLQRLSGRFLGTWACASARRRPPQPTARQALLAAGVWTSGKWWSQKRNFGVPGWKWLKWKLSGTSGLFRWFPQQLFALSQLGDYAVPFSWLQFLRSMTSLEGFLHRMTILQEAWIRTDIRKLANQVENIASKFHLENRSQLVSWSHQILAAKPHLFSAQSAPNSPRTKPLHCLAGHRLITTSGHWAARLFFCVASWIGNFHGLVMLRSKAQQNISEEWC